MNQGEHAHELSDRALQRGAGSGKVVLDGTKEHTRIVELFQQSPVRIFFPWVDERVVAEAVVANTAGGLAGGDRFDMTLIALAESTVRVTSQAAERVYRALSEPACIFTTLRVCDAARVAWLPQETILFDGGRLRRETTIELSSDAELLALEWLVLGRAAHGEEVLGGQIVESWRVRKNGRLIWADTFRITGDVFPDLRRKVLLGDCKAVGTLVYAGPRVDVRLAASREIGESLRCHFAATSVGGLVIMRFAARIASELKRALRTFLERFNLGLGSGPFGVPKMWSC